MLHVQVDCFLGEGGADGGEFAHAAVVVQRGSEGTLAVEGDAERDFSLFFGLVGLADSDIIHGFVGSGGL